MNEYCYVYVLRSLKDQMFYVGFTKNLKGRVEAHKRRLGSFDKATDTNGTRLLGRVSQPIGCH